MHYNNLIISSDFSPVGRGLTLVLSLKLNKFTETNHIDELPFKKGDTLMWNNKKYEMKYFELSIEPLNGKIGHSIGIAVKEITND